ncbi:hypothetical protein EYA84_13250, partial [Verrucosispora sp. SN26_14.1]|uniref:hypothetical protein n=1 Tax=Verrucosispora sp. SN26_14.1 TaxID=2527879 RepID=UPI001033216E
MAVPGRFVLTGAMTQTTHPVARAVAVATPAPDDGTLVYLIEETPRSAAGLDYLRGQPFPDALVLVPWDLDRWATGGQPLPDDPEGLGGLADLYRLQVQVPVGEARAPQLVPVDARGREASWDDATSVRVLPWSHVAGRAALRAAYDRIVADEEPGRRRVEALLADLEEIRRALRVSIPPGSLAAAIHLVRSGNEPEAAALLRKVLPIAVADVPTMVGGSAQPIAADVLRATLRAAPESAALVSYRAPNGGPAVAWLLPDGEDVRWVGASDSDTMPIAVRLTDDWRMVALRDAATTVVLIDADHRPVSVDVETPPVPAPSGETAEEWADHPPVIEQRSAEVEARLAEMRRTFIETGTELWELRSASTAIDHGRDAEEPAASSGTADLAAREWEIAAEVDRQRTRIAELTKITEHEPIEETPDGVLHSYVWVRQAVEGRAGYVRIPVRVDEAGVRSRHPDTGALTGEFHLDRGEWLRPLRGGGPGLAPAWGSPVGPSATAGPVDASPAASASGTTPRRLLDGMPQQYRPSQRSDWTATPLFAVVALPPEVAFTIGLEARTTEDHADVHVLRPVLDGSAGMANGLVGFGVGRLPRIPLDGDVIYVALAQGGIDVSASPALAAVSPSVPEVLGQVTGNNVLAAWRVSVDASGAVRLGPVRPNPLVDVRDETGATVGLPDVDRLDTEIVELLHVMVAQQGPAPGRGQDDPVRPANYRSFWSMDPDYWAEVRSQVRDNVAAFSDEVDVIRQQGAWQELADRFAERLRAPRIEVLLLDIDGQGSFDPNSWIMHVGRRGPLDQRLTTFIHESFHVEQHLVMFGAVARSTNDFAVLRAMVSQPSIAGSLWRHPLPVEDPRYDAAIRTLWDRKVLDREGGTIFMARNSASAALSRAKQRLATADAGFNPVVRDRLAADLTRSYRLWLERTVRALARPMEIPAYVVERAFTTGGSVRDWQRVHPEAPRLPGYRAETNAAGAHLWPEHAERLEDQARLVHPARPQIVVEVGDTGNAASVLSQAAEVLPASAMVVLVTPHRLSPEEAVELAGLLADDQVLAVGAATATPPTGDDRLIEHFVGHSPWHDVSMIPFAAYFTVHRVPQAPEIVGSGLPQMSSLGGGTFDVLGWQAVPVGDNLFVRPADESPQAQPVPADAAAGVPRLVVGVPGRDTPWGVVQVANALVDYLTGVPNAASDPRLLQVHRPVVKAPPLPGLSIEPEPNAPGWTDRLPSLIFGADIDRNEPRIDASAGDLGLDRHLLMYALLGAVDARPAEVMPEQLVVAIDELTDRLSVTRSELLTVGYVTAMAYGVGGVTEPRLRQAQRLLRALLDTAPGVPMPAGDLAVRYLLQAVGHNSDDHGDVTGLLRLFELVEARHSEGNAVSLTMAELAAAFDDDRRWRESPALSPRRLDSGEETWWLGPPTEQHEVSAVPGHIVVGYAANTDLMPAQMPVPAGVAALAMTAVAVRERLPRQWGPDPLPLLLVPVTSELVDADGLRTDLARLDDRVRFGQFRMERLNLMLAEPVIRPETTPPVAVGLAHLAGMRRELMARAEELRRLRSRLEEAKRERDRAGQDQVRMADAIRRIADLSTREWNIQADIHHRHSRITELTRLVGDGQVTATASGLTSHARVRISASDGRLDWLRVPVLVDEAGVHSTHPETGEITGDLRLVDGEWTPRLLGGAPGSSQRRVGSSSARRSGPGSSSAARTAVPGATPSASAIVVPAGYTEQNLRRTLPDRYVESRRPDWATRPLWASVPIPPELAFTTGLQQRVTRHDDPGGVQPVFGGTAGMANGLVGFGVGRLHRMPADGEMVYAVVASGGIDVWGSPATAAAPRTAPDVLGQFTGTSVVAGWPVSVDPHTGQIILGQAAANPNLAVHREGSPAATLTALDGELAAMLTRLAGKHDTTLTRGDAVWTPSRVIEDYGLLEATNPAYWAELRRLARRDQGALGSGREQHRAWQKASDLLFRYLNAGSNGIPAARTVVTDLAGTGSSAMFDGTGWTVEVGESDSIDDRLAFFAHEGLHAEQYALMGRLVAGASNDPETLDLVTGVPIAREALWARPLDRGDPRYSLALRLWWHHHSELDGRIHDVRRDAALLRRRTEAQLVKALEIGQFSAPVRQLLTARLVGRTAHHFELGILLVRLGLEGPAYRAALDFSTGGSVRDWQKVAAAEVPALAGYQVERNEAGSHLWPASVGRQDSSSRLVHHSRPTVVVELGRAGNALSRLADVVPHLPADALVAVVTSDPLTPTQAVELASTVGEGQTVAVSVSSGPRIDPADPLFDHFVPYSRWHAQSMSLFADYFTVHTEPQRPLLRLNYALKPLYNVGGGVFIRQNLSDWQIRPVGQTLWVRASDEPAGALPVPAEPDNGMPRIVVGAPGRDTPWAIVQLGLLLAEQLTGVPDSRGMPDLVQIHRPVLEPPELHDLTPVETAAPFTRQLLVSAFGEHGVDDPRLTHTSKIEDFDIDPYVLTAALVGAVDPAPQAMSESHLVEVLTGLAARLGVTREELLPVGFVTAFAHGIGHVTVPRLTVVTRALQALPDRGREQPDESRILNSFRSLVPDDNERSAKHELLRLLEWLGHPGTTWPAEGLSSEYLQQVVGRDRSWTDQVLSQRTPDGSGVWWLGPVVQRHLVAPVEDTLVLAYAAGADLLPVGMPVPGGAALLMRVGQLVRRQLPEEEWGTPVLLVPVISAPADSDRLRAELTETENRLSLGVTMADPVVVAVEDDAAADPMDLDESVVGSAMGQQPEDAVRVRLATMREHLTRWAEHVVRLRADGAGADTSTEVARAQSEIDRLRERITELTEVVAYGPVTATGRGLVGRVSVRQWMEGRFQRVEIPVFIDDAGVHGLHPETSELTVDLRLVNGEWMPRVLGGAPGSSSSRRGGSGSSSARRGGSGSSSAGTAAAASAPSVPAIVVPPGYTEKQLRRNWPDWFAKSRRPGWETETLWASVPIPPELAFTTGLQQRVHDGPDGVMPVFDGLAGMANGLVGFGVDRLHRMPADGEMVYAVVARGGIDVWGSPATKAAPPTAPDVLGQFPGSTVVAGWLVSVDPDTGEVTLHKVAENPNFSVRRKDDHFQRVTPPDPVDLDDALVAMLAAMLADPAGNRGTTLVRGVEVWQPRKAADEYGSLWARDPALWAELRVRARKEYRTLGGGDRQRRAWQEKTDLIFRHVRRGADVDLTPARSIITDVSDEHHAARFDGTTWELEVGQSDSVDYMLEGLAHEGVHAEQYTLMGRLVAGATNDREAMDRVTRAGHVQDALWAQPLRLDDERYPLALNLWWNHYTRIDLDHSNLHIRAEELSFRNAAQVLKVRGIEQFSPPVRQLLEARMIGRAARDFDTGAMMFRLGLEGAAYRAGLEFSTGGSVRDWQKVSAAKVPSLSRYRAETSEAGTHLWRASAERQDFSPRLVHRSRPTVVVELGRAENALSRLAGIVPRLPANALVEVVTTDPPTPTQAVELASAVGAGQVLAVSASAGLRIDPADELFDHFVPYSRWHAQSMSLFADYFTVHPEPQWPDFHLTNTLASLINLGGGLFTRTNQVDWQIGPVGQTLWVHTTDVPSTALPVPVESGLGMPRIVVGAPDRDTPWTIVQLGLLLAERLTGIPDSRGDLGLVQVHRPVLDPPEWDDLPPGETAAPWTRQLLTSAFVSEGDIDDPQLEHISDVGDFDIDPFLLTAALVGAVEPAPEALSEFQLVEVLNGLAATLGITREELLPVGFATAYAFGIGHVTVPRLALVTRALLALTDYRPDLDFGDGYESNAPRDTGEPIRSWLLTDFRRLVPQDDERHAKQELARLLEWLAQPDTTWPSDGLTSEYVQQVLGQDRSWIDGSLARRTRDGRGVWWLGPVAQRHLVAPVEGTHVLAYQADADLLPVGLPVPGGAALLARVGQRLRRDLPEGERGKPVPVLLVPVTSGPVENHWLRSDLTDFENRLALGVTMAEPVVLMSSDDVDAALAQMSLDEVAATMGQPSGWPASDESIDPESPLWWTGSPVDPVEEPVSIGGATQESQSSPPPVPIGTNGVEDELVVTRAQARLASWAVPDRLVELRRLADEGRPGAG